MCTVTWSVALVLAIVFVVGRRRMLLVVALAAAIALITVYRGHVVDTEGVFTALIRTCRPGSTDRSGAPSPRPSCRGPAIEPLRRPVLVGTVAGPGAR